MVWNVEGVFIIESWADIFKIDSVLIEICKALGLVPFEFARIIHAIMYIIMDILTRFILHFPDVLLGCMPMQPCHVANAGVAASSLAKPLAAFLGEPRPLAGVGEPKPAGGGA